jgi:hypothetical protein
VENVVANIPHKLVKKYEDPYFVYRALKIREGYYKIEENIKLKKMPIRGKKIIQKRL